MGTKMTMSGAVRTGDSRYICEACEAVLDKPGSFRFRNKEDYELHKSHLLHQTCQEKYDMDVEQRRRQREKVTTPLRDHTPSQYSVSGESNEPIPEDDDIETRRRTKHGRRKTAAIK